MVLAAPPPVWSLGRMQEEEFRLLLILFLLQEPPGEQLSHHARDIKIRLLGGLGWGALCAQLYRKKRVKWTWKSQWPCIQIMYLSATMWIQCICGIVNLFYCHEFRVEWRSSTYQARVLSDSDSVFVSPGLVSASAELWEGIGAEWGKCTFFKALIIWSREHSSHLVCSCCMDEKRRRGLNCDKYFCTEPAFV